MHPILFEIPIHPVIISMLAAIGFESGSSLPIYSYGVMLGLSLIVGWYLTLGLAEHHLERVLPVVVARRVREVLRDQRRHPDRARGEQDQITRQGQLLGERG